MKRQVLSLALAAILLLSSFVSCGLQTGAVELSDGYQSRVTLEGKPEEQDIAAIADFSVALLKQVKEEGSNTVLSPLSLYYCLGMLMNGAAGKTAEQFAETLGLSAEQLNKTLYLLTQVAGDNGQLTMANSIWMRNEEHRLHVDPAFLQTNADYYGAQAYSAPFDDSTLKAINKWCERQTDGMIDKILDKLPYEAVLCVINAMKFDAEWEEKYEKKDIHDGIFHNADGSETEVKMLSSEENFFIRGENFTGFRRRYKEGKYSFVGLLPDETSGVGEVLAGLTGETWLAAVTKSQGGVSVQMPEFTMEMSMELNEMLIKMGISDAFDAGAADFSAMGYSEAGNLFLGLVKQAVKIEVDRNGTKAAAVSIGMMKDGCAMLVENQVILDRPFIYAVLDNETGLPIFIGVMENMNATK